MIAQVITELAPPDRVDHRSQGVAVAGVDSLSSPCEVPCPVRLRSGSAVANAAAPAVLAATAVEATAAPHAQHTGTSALR